jgi:hypothetical protein
VALALAALVLLPGLLVARAPWTVVPALSLAFWVLSWWWPLLSGSRGRAVATCLLVFSLLAVLRVLPKHEVPPPPGWEPPPPPPAPRGGPAAPRLLCAPSVGVLLAGLLLLAPLPLWHHAPGERLAFQTTIARVLLWRDGVPRSAEPLLSLAPVGAHAPALATLAADVARLSGRDPGPSLLVVTIASASLALLGLFGLLATWLEPRAAALASLLICAALPWPGFLAPLGEGETLVASVFLLPAVALLAGRESRSSGLAAGLLLGAAALAQPVLAVLVTLGLGAAAALESLPAGTRAGQIRRLAQAVCLALVLSGPGLRPLVQALSLRELAAIAWSPRLGDLPALTTGALGATLAVLVARLPWARSRRGRALAAVLGLGSAVLLVVRVHSWVAAGQLDPAPRAALARAASGSPLEPLCAPPAVLSWVPALAGRPPGEPGPWIPSVYADEWQKRPRRPCRGHLESLLNP